MFAHSQGAERGEEEVISLMINVSVVLAQDANTCKASRLTHTRTHTHTCRACTLSGQTNSSI